MGPPQSSIAVRIVGAAKHPSTVLLLGQQHKLVSFSVQRKWRLDLFVLNFIVQKPLLQLFDLVQTFQFFPLLLHQDVRLNHEQQSIIVQTVPQSNLVRGALHCIFNFPEFLVGAAARVGHPDTKLRAVNSSGKHHLPETQWLLLVEYLHWRWHLEEDLLIFCIQRT